MVGPTRLPDFDDRPNLPYINALCKEVMQWRPIVPLGFPHRVTQDDVEDISYPKEAMYLKMHGIR